jgi:hypothetical protein
MIIDVDCEDDTTHVAKVVNDFGDDTFMVKFLEKRSNSTYCFSSEEEKITRDMISGYYDVENLEDTGHFMKERGDVYVPYHESDDEDFTCSETESVESDDSVSLVDEEEEE